MLNLVHHVTASLVRFTPPPKDVASFAAAGPYELEATVKYEVASTTPDSATAVMPTNSLYFASPRFSDHLFAAISPPNGRAPASRIWSKLPASHWASTPSSDSVYETHICAKNEFPSRCQGTAGNCRCI